MHVIEIDTYEEEKILACLITSERFCTQILPTLRGEYFQNDYCKKIYRWLLRYYEDYKKPPQKYINDIFIIKKRHLTEDEIEIISILLETISIKFTAEKEINIEFEIDQALVYIEKRAIIYMASMAQIYAEKDNIPDARKVIQNFREVAKTTSTWVNPFQEQYVKDVFSIEAAGTDKLFRFPGKLGDFLGDFERDWLIAFTGPMKKGKTWALLSCALNAVYNRRKTVVIELEMKERRIAKRLYHSITGLSKLSGIVTIPVFDCIKNQRDVCFKQERSNRMAAPFSDHNPIYRTEYKPCTYCRDNTTKERNEYELATWKVLIEKEGITEETTTKKTNDIITNYGDILRVNTYPADTANLSMIKKDLDTLAYTDDFIPDVIIIDYADLLAADDYRLHGLDKTDHIWKRLKGLATERSCLVVTASQSNRATLDKKDVKSTDIAGDIRKLAHCDAMYSINQTPEEKIRGVSRLGYLGFREGEFLELKYCYVLQNYNIGQVVIDSEMQDQNQEQYNEG